MILKSECWNITFGFLEIQPNLYLRTQLVEDGCTSREKYLNCDVNFHGLTCEVV